MSNLFYNINSRYLSHSLFPFPHGSPLFNKCIDPFKRILSSAQPCHNFTVEDEPLTERHIDHLIIEFFPYFDCHRTFGNKFLGKSKSLFFQFFSGCHVIYQADTLCLYLCGCFMQSSIMPAFSMIIGI